MSVDSITGNTAAFQMQPSSPTGSANKPVNGTSATEVKPDNKPLKSDSAAILNSDAGGNILKPKQPQAASEPAGVVSHVVVSYNQQGKLRTKFVDSRNNVVYQLPSEMTAKLEDQLLAANSSTNVKA